MPRSVHVDLGERSYDIEIGPGLLDRIGELARRAVRGTNSLVVTDATVGALYAGRCSDALAGAGLAVGRCVVPAGEGSKDGRWLFHVYEKALEQGLDRKGFIVALGGGVVGDLAGYAAASYLRGIPYIQVPTTLLAMVDSAVGGKTGINLPQGKNLVGAFHQPALVACDTGTLDTLPRREYVAGLAEVIKYGVIRDAELFAVLESRAQDVLAGDRDLVERIVARSCEIKAQVVSADEREGGLRAILNFGHTLGHALETVSGYGHFLHGEAVAVGMAYAARLSVELQGLPRRDGERIVRLIGAYGLPVEAGDYPWHALRMVMGVDKKSAAGVPRFVLAERIGSVTPGCSVPEDVLQRLWESRLQRQHGF